MKSAIKMIDKYLLGFTLMIFSLSSTTLAESIIQVTAGLESSKFIDGLDTTNGKPVATLGADLSFDNGLFFGANCFKSETLFFRDGIDAGCDYFAGYFHEANNDQALSISLTRSQYVPIPASASEKSWNYTTAALNWHANRSTVVTVSTVDSWLGRGYSYVGINVSHQRFLNEQWSLNAEARYLDFASRAPVNSIDYFRLGLRFERGRWASELNAHLGNHNLQQLVPFEKSELNFSLNLSYRLY